MAILADGTYSFDSDPAYSEFGGDGNLWSGFGCSGGVPTGQRTYSIATTFARDAAVKRFGNYSAHITAPSDGYDPYSCNILRISAIIFPPVRPVEGDEAWYGFNFRFPATFPSLGGWSTITEWATDHTTHDNYGMVTFDVSSQRFSIVFHTGLTTNKNAVYNVTEPLLGSGQVRPFTLNVWHDFYIHVVWGTNRPAKTTGIWEIWHREEGGTWAKLYSNKNDGSALINRASHPTLMFNTQYGAPGENGTQGLYYRNIGLYRSSGGSPPTVDYWTEGIRWRGSQAAILATFPSEEAPSGPTNPPDPAAGRTRLGFVPSTDAVTDLAVDRKRMTERDAIPAGATIQIHKIYAKLQGAVSGGASTHKAIVYAKTGGVPAALVGTGGEVSVAQGAALAWIDMGPAAPIQVVTPCYVGLLSGGALGKFALETASPGYKYNTDTYSDGPADPAGAMTDTSPANELGIVADYTVVSDVIAPVLVSAQVRDETLTLTYDELLDEASVPATSSYAIVHASNPIGVSAVAIAGATVSLTLSGPATADATVTASYTAPGSGKVRDLAANNAANLTSQAVVNETQLPPGNPPALTRPSAGSRPSGDRPASAGRPSATIRPAS